MLFLQQQQIKSKNLCILFIQQQHIKVKKYQHSNNKTIDFRSTWCSTKLFRPKKNYRWSRSHRHSNDLDIEKHQKTISFALQLPLTDFLKKINLIFVISTQKNPQNDPIFKVLRAFTR